MSTRHLTTLLGAALLPLALAAQQTPPAPTALRPVQFPPFQEARLSGGLDVVVVENHEQPTVTVSLTFRAGSINDPNGKEGLASFVAELLTKGTPTRTADQFAEAIEGVGGSIGAGADDDFLTISASALTDHVAIAFTLLGDAIRNATYPETELELMRTRSISAYQAALAQPEALAEWFFVSEVYQPHPYSRHGTADSYRAITRADVTGFASRYLRPGGALMVVAGDITLARVRELMRAHFGGWTGAAPAAAAQPTPRAKASTDILLVHRPGSVQANILLGNTTFVPTDTNYIPLRLATHVLGGGTDARLFAILREQKGWTYGSYSRLERNRGVGSWRATAETRTDVADSALAELLRQVDRMRTEAVPDSELVNAKGFLVGSFPLTIETPRDVAAQVANVRRLGLPRDYLQTYRERLSGVTAARAQAAASRYYRRDSLTIVVVGDATRLLDRLKLIAPVRVVDAEGKALTADDLAPKAGPVALDRAQLVARTDSFNVVIQGNVLGSQVWQTTVTRDSLVFQERLSIPAAAISQHTTVRWNAADLTVATVKQTGSAQGQRSEIDLTYGSGRVKGSSTVPQPGGTPKSVTVDTTVAPGTYDDNAISLILPALTLTPGATINVGVFSSGDGVSRVMTVKVGPAQSVTVPAGTFDAFRLDVSGGQAPLVFYVTTGTPRRVVKIEVVGAPFAFELAK